MTPDGLKDGEHADLLQAALREFGGIRAARVAARIPKPERRYSGLRQWTMTTVVTEIRIRRREGLSVAFSRVPPALLTAGQRYYGSWREAVQAARIDYRAVQLRTSYSDSEILASLRETAARRPDALVTEIPKSLAELARLRFGSVADAAAKAGLRGWPHEGKEHFDPDVVKARIRARAVEGQPVYERAVLRSEPKLRDAGRRHFGSWRSALAAAGVENDSPSSRPVRKRRLTRRA